MEYSILYFSLLCNGAFYNKFAIDVHTLRVTMDAFVLHIISALMLRYFDIFKNLLFCTFFRQQTYPNLHHCILTWSFFHTFPEGIQLVVEREFYDGVIIILVVLPVYTGSALFLKYGSRCYFTTPVAW